VEVGIFKPFTAIYRQTNKPVSFLLIVVYYIKNLSHPHHRMLTSNVTLDLPFKTLLKEKSDDKENKGSQL
jgi:hypothetical protein